MRMQLMDELIDAYLDSDFDHPYYLDLQTGEVILDLDEADTGVPGIDWDDEASEGRYVNIPKIGSREAYAVMTRFAQTTESDPDNLLLAALDRNRPFRGFKDTLYDLNLWDPWNQFEQKQAEEAIREWLAEEGLDYEELNSKYKEELTEMEASRLESEQSGQMD
jgi:hypothetical protein